MSVQASVRLLINYNKSHKAVVRVSPRIPLEMLLPVVCDKCELNLETTVLLRDSESKELLDLTKTLNEHGLREVFAKDTAAREPVDNEQQSRTPEGVNFSILWSLLFFLYEFVHPNWHHSLCCVFTSFIVVFMLNKTNNVLKSIKSSNYINLYRCVYID